MKTPDRLGNGGRRAVGAQDLGHDRACPSISEVSAAENPLAIARERQNKSLTR